MDKRKTIRTRLNTIFCDLSKKDKKYLEVWLSDVDFGGLYHSDKYVLNVRAGHVINGSKDEIDYVLALLDAEAKEALQSIWQIRVFDTSDEIHCASDEILVYSEETSCK